MKTLKELNVNPGDVVEHSDGEIYEIRIAEDGELANWDIRHGYWGITVAESTQMYTIISRASDEPKKFGDMTPDEKGALLLAHHEGKAIEVWNGEYWECVEQIFAEFVAYRIKPEPKIEVVNMYADLSECGMFGSTKNGDDTHTITFTTIDGVPDCSSIKMDAL